MHSNLIQNWPKRPEKYPKKQQSRDFWQALPIFLYTRNATPNKRYLTSAKFFANPFASQKISEI